MNTKDIELFLQIYKSHSFNQASQHLYISTQGLVKVVKRLEDELGTNLFTRTHQGIIPTADGTYFYSEMKDVIDKFNSVKRHFLTDEKKEKLRFAYTQGIMSMLTIDYIDKFKIEFPHIELTLEEGTDKLVQSEIINGHADIGIISSPFDDSHLQSLFFTKVKNVVVLNIDDALAKKDKISYADFNNRKVAMIAQASNTYRQLLDKIHESGANPSQIYESDQLMFNHQRASENMCMGQSIDIFTKQFAYPNTIIKDYEDSDFYWETYFVWLKDKPFTKTMEQFISFTKQFLKIVTPSHVSPSV